jgi:hypothetical protein
VRCSHGKNDATDVVVGFDASVSVGNLFEGDHGVDERAQGVLDDELPEAVFRGGVRCANTDDPLVERMYGTQALGLTPLGIF